LLGGAGGSGEKNTSGERESGSAVPAVEGSAMLSIVSQQCCRRQTIARVFARHGDAAVV